MGRNFKTDRIKEEIIGKEFETVYGEKYTVIDYIDTHNVTVEFDGGYISYENNKADVIKGNVKNRLRKYNYGKYLGDKTTHDKRTIRMWSGMFLRCYDEFELERNPNYKGCEIYEDWFCFENFSKWYDDNKWGEDLKLQVDKDILFKRNKLYSPKTCILVPQRINNLFVQSVGSQTRNGLIGTYLNKNGKYTSQCQTESKTNKNLGSFDNEIDAFLKYKEVREAYIKRIADEYKQKYQDFPQVLYEAMYRYEVEITD